MVALVLRPRVSVRRPVGDRSAICAVFLQLNYRSFFSFFLLGLLSRLYIVLFRFLASPLAILSVVLIALASYCFLCHSFTSASFSADGTGPEGSFVQAFVPPGKADESAAALGANEFPLAGDFLSAY